LVEEQKVLQGELDKEKQRRRDAEEAERLARAEMRLAEESRAKSRTTATSLTLSRVLIQSIPRR